MNQTGTSSIEVEMLRLTLFISIDAQSVALMHVGEIDMIFFFFLKCMYALNSYYYLFLVSPEGERALCLGW